LGGSLDLPKSGARLLPGIEEIVDLEPEAAQGLGPELEIAVGDFLQLLSGKAVVCAPNG